MENPRESKTLKDDRRAYRGDDGTIVIRNPHDPDGGTAYRPDDPKAEFD
jgi:hypothetical protein